MSELENYEVKVKMIEGQWSNHRKVYETIINVFQEYCTIENRKAEQLKSILPQLDNIHNVFYDDIVNKLANYLDTNIYQTNELIESLNDMLVDYRGKFATEEKEYNSLLNEYKRSKNQVIQSLNILYANVTKKSLFKAQVNTYNQTIDKYLDTNKNLLEFRDSYQEKLRSVTSDQIMRFFIIEMEKLRNNQFDVDQILKRSSGGTDDQRKQYFTYMDINKQIQWRKISSLNVTLKDDTWCQMNELNLIIKSVLQESSSSQENVISQLFDNSNWKKELTSSKISSLLEAENQQFTNALKKVFKHFEDHSTNIFLQKEEFRNILEISKCILEYCIENCNVELLQGLSVFLKHIKSEIIICKQKQAELYETVSLISELKSHRYLSQEYWIKYQQEMSNNKDTNQQKCKQFLSLKKSIRKFGICLPDGGGVKEKKKIFQKIEGVRMKDAI